MKKNIRIRRRDRGNTVRIDKLRPAAQPGWYKRFRQLVNKATRTKLR